MSLLPVNMIRLRNEDQPWPVSFVAITFFIVLAILPVGVMLAKSSLVDGRLSTLHYITVFTDQRVLQLLLKSLFMALGATLLILLFGTPLALFLGRSRFPGITVCRFLCLVPLLIPSHVHTLAWINLLGENGIITKLLNGIVTIPSLFSISGVILLLAFSYFPILVLMLLIGLSRIRAGQEESALLVRSPVAVLCKVTLPLLQPYLVSGAVLVFVLAFFNYGIPSMLRVSSFPVEILVRFSAFYDEGGAAALSLPMIGIAMILLLLQHRYLRSRSFATVTTTAGRLPAALLPAPPGAVFIVMIILLTVFLPLSSLLHQAGGLLAYAMAIKTSVREILITLLLAVTAATYTTLLAFFLSHFTENSRTRNNRCRQMVKMAVYLPLAFPATFFGIGLIYLWNHPLTEIFYATWSILVIAYIARFIPFSMAIVTVGLQQISPGLGDAAYLCQPSWFKRLWYIHLPLAKRSLLLSWVIIFIFSMGELGATLLVIPPGMGTISLKLYTLMHYGAGPLVAALSILLVITNLAVALTVVGMLRRGKI